MLPFYTGNHCTLAPAVLSDTKRPIRRSSGAILLLVGARRHYDITRDAAAVSIDLPHTAHYVHV